MIAEQTRSALVPIELAPRVDIAIRERVTVVAAAVALLVLIGGYVATQIDSIIPVIIAMIMPVGVFCAITIMRKPHRVFITPNRVTTHRVLRHKTAALAEISKAVMVPKYHHPTAGVQQRLVIVGMDGKPAMTFTTGFWPRLSVELIRNKLQAAGVPLETVAEHQRPGALRKSHPEAVTWWDRHWRGVLVAGAVVSVGLQIAVRTLAG